MVNDDGLYWTVRNNWDGKLWPRLWQNERAAWAALKDETGLTKKTIQETCDWTVVMVKIVEVVPNAKNIAVFGAYTETNDREGYVALDKLTPNASNERPASAGPLD